MGKDTWKDKPERDAALLGSVQRHTNPDTGRKSWKNIQAELNDQFKEDNSKALYRCRWVRLTGAVNATDQVRSSPGDPDALLNAIKVMDKPGAAQIMEDLIQPRFPDTKLPEFSWEEVYEVAERLADISNKAQPTITSATVHIPSDKPIALMNTADWHIGSRFMAYKTLGQFSSSRSQYPGYSGVFLVTSTITSRWTGFPLQLCRLLHPPLKGRSFMAS